MYNEVGGFLTMQKKRYFVSYKVNMLTNNVLLWVRNVHKRFGLETFIRGLCRLGNKVAKKRITTYILVVTRVVQSNKLKLHLRNSLLLLGSIVERDTVITAGRSWKWPVGIDSPSEIQTDNQVSIWRQLLAQGGRRDLDSYEEQYRDRVSREDTGCPFTRDTQEHMTVVRAVSDARGLPSPPRAYNRPPVLLQNYLIWEPSTTLRRDLESPYCKWCNLWLSKHS